MEEGLMHPDQFTWLREPRHWEPLEDGVRIVTEPHTDLWQRTYYHFRNDSAPCFLAVSGEPFFTFTVRTDFPDVSERFDQCGVVVYQNSQNWLKASVERETDEMAHLGSVVTTAGYSDWATQEIPSSIRTMWYRLSRRESDFVVESSRDGLAWSMLRMCHMPDAEGAVRFGVYACSPEEGSFNASFTRMHLGECAFGPHDGQQPDKEEQD